MNEEGSGKRAGERVRGGRGGGGGRGSERKGGGGGGGVEGLKSCTTLYTQPETELPGDRQAASEVIK